MNVFMRSILFCTCPQASPFSSSCHGILLWDHSIQCHWRLFPLDHLPAAPTKETQICIYFQQPKHTKYTNTSEVYYTFWVVLILSAIFLFILTLCQMFDSTVGICKVISFGYLQSYEWRDLPIRALGIPPTLRSVLRTSPFHFDWMTKLSKIKP